MPHYGILHDFEFQNVDDIRGADVYGVNDEHLGTVDDVVFDHANGEIRYVVVNAGGWLSSKKFLVPANRIEPYGNREDKFYAELDKERIQMLPEYKEDTLKSESGWTDYEKRYQEHWNKGAVMYNKETGRIVTPPANEVEGTRTRPLSKEGKRSLMHDFTPAKMGHEADLLGVASGPSKDTTLTPTKASIGGREDVLLQEQSSKQPASASMGPGPRWNEFQRQLRERRDEVVSGCSLCGTQEKVA